MSHLVANLAALPPVFPSRVAQANESIQYTTAGLDRSPFMESSNRRK
jgi:hypothetical protein